MHFIYFAFFFYVVLKKLPVLRSKSMKNTGFVWTGNLFPTQWYFWSGSVGSDLYME